MSRARQISREISKGQLIPLLFSQTAVAISQTGVALGVMSTSADVIEYVIPFDFEIVAITTSLNQARSAGTMSVDATINTTAATSARNTFGSAIIRHSTKLPRNSVTGVAGDRVGAKVTTDGTWAPVTSNDMVTTVWVLVSLEGI